MEENPYKAPEVAEVSAESLVSEPERIRREHLKHETSLKGAGTLMILGAVLVGLSMVSMFAMMVPRSSSGGVPSGAMPGGLELLILGIFGVVLVLQFVTGIGLRRLAPWSWIPALIVSALSLLSFPIGTLIGGYFLYLLIAPKGRRILSGDYREVVRQTPHIKYRTPWWMWLILILILLGLAGMIAWFRIA